MENSKIEWCHHTINFWQGCTKVSAGCAHCYAEAYDKRFKGGENWRGSRLDKRGPATAAALKLNRKAEKLKTRCRVFSLSMGDWLDPEVPSEWLADMLNVISHTPNLDWLLLTKRPENFQSHLTKTLRWFRDPGQSLPRLWRDGINPDNVWVGTSVENQEQADLRIPQLLKIPAARIFLSCEPLLGPVILREEWIPEIDWTIVGGESGPKARPMDPAWARSLRDQTMIHSMSAFFMKQMGGTKDKRAALEDLPMDLQFREFPEAIPF